MSKKRESGVGLFPEIKLTFADFFCGCGGLSLGFIKAGLKCISAMDIAPDALWTYWYNLCYKGWSHFYVNPDNPNMKYIKKSKMWDNGKTGNVMFENGIPDNWLSPEMKDPVPCLNVFMYSILDLDPEEWMEMCGVRPGNVSIFAGGPPCQGFSSCNHNRSIMDERNQLPERFIYYCKVCKPGFVLMENVPGILTLGKKKGDREGPFPVWLREKFEDAGYCMEYRILDAKDYGVPQRRKRVFFFAARNDVQYADLFPPQTHGKYLKAYVTVLEAIGHLPPLHDGEHWGKDVLHPYGYNPVEGHVICHACLHYNLDSRNECHHCGTDLSDPIRGGILHLPGFGIMLGTQTTIDNEQLRNSYS